MSLTTLIDQYSAGPALVRQAVAGMTRQQALARPIAGKWSSLEVVCHLADFEIVYVDRLAAVIAEDGPTLPGRDEQKFASRLAYHERDLEEQLRVIEGLRGHMTRVLRTLKETDLARVGNHTEAGPLSLEQLLGRATGHVQHHVKFIHEKRAAM
jgi:hypothetical protein